MEQNLKDSSDGGRARALATLNEVISVCEGANGKSYPLTRIDLLGRQWRRMAVELLRVLDPEGFKQYREMKYAKGPSPDLATRRAAYEFAARRFLKISYRVAGY